MKTLIIRADAGGFLGTGHVMRMVALAQAVRNRNTRVVIASVQCPPQIIDLVQNFGVEHRLLTSCELGSKEDAAETYELCSQLGNDWLVLDGYHFSADYQQEITEKGQRVMVLDDYGHCESWSCEAVLNQNLGAENTAQRNSDQPNTQWLMGASYALLREEFTASIANSTVRESPAQSVLVTLGGADPDNVTLRVLQAIEHSALERLTIRVLVGGANIHQNELALFGEASRHELELLSNVRDMPAMYKWADAVISAGGSTCWEWLALGLTGAIITIADNQEQVVSELKSRRLALSLGWFTEFDLDRWSRQLEAWLKGEHAGASFEERRKVIDGYGAARVASFLDGGVWCRKAAASDVLRYFEWANDSAVRSNSFNSEAIEFTGHKKWFESKVASKNSILLVCNLPDGSPVGQVRFDLNTEAERWFIDYSIGCAYRGQGLGGASVEAALMYLRAELKIPFELAAEVKLGNIASSRIFEKLGFIKESVNLQSSLYILKSR